MCFHLERQKLEVVEPNTSLSLWQEFHAKMSGKQLVEVKAMPLWRCHNGMAESFVGHFCDTRPLPNKKATLVSGLII